jgi:hygromycin-B 7''-O-kinase
MFFKYGGSLLLPEVKTLDGYRKIYRDESVWLPAMRVICERHGLDAALLEFAPPGSHVVFRVGPELYVKLFAPLWRRDYLPEKLVLDKLSGQFDWPLPHLMAEGEIEGWPYLIVTAVDGAPLNEVWSAMEEPDREHIAARCGEFMAWLHSMPIEGLEEIAVDWPAFVERQIQSCVQQLEQSELDERLIRSTVVFLDDLPSLFEPAFQPVLLSADVTDEHILVSKCDGRWELTGYIDFGDAMVGHPYYEFVAPGCCITYSSPRLRRAMLLGYGFSANQLDERLSEQLMGHTLTHRFIDVPYLLTLFEGQQLVSLNDLQRALWSLPAE